MNNAELLVRMLREAGVRWVFGVPSGPVLPLIEALRQSEVEFVLTASETSAGFMASTVGQLTDAPGVCVATLGPGATNMATGVGAAWLDRSPVLAITCNVATPWLDRRTQMRIDHQALYRPLTKGSFALTRENLARTVAEALSLAQAEPPGPVHLDLPEDVALAPAPPVPSSEFKVPREFRVPSSKFPVRSGDSELGTLNSELAARALATAERPLVVTGLTFTRSRASAHLLRFIERQRLPFVSTLHAKGFLPESHPNWCGVLGRARRSDVQRFVDRADLILAVGFDPIEINYEEWAGSTPIIHLSTEVAEPGPGLRLLVNMAVDLDRAIEDLAALPSAANGWSADDFAAHRRALERALRPESPALAPHHVVDLVREKLPSDGILTYDVGAHTHQIATQWRTDYPWTCLATNGWSSMGYGMPAAYAAKLVHRNRAVISIIGDGGFQMTAGELALARRLSLPVPIVVLNDGWLGLMKVKQERRGYDLHGVQLGAPVPSPPHYFGVPCRAARNTDEVSDALDWALGLGGPSVIEAFVDVEPYSQTVFD